MAGNDRFKSSQWDIRSEKEIARQTGRDQKAPPPAALQAGAGQVSQQGDFTVVKFEQQAKSVVEEYHFGKIAKPGDMDFQAVQQKLGGVPGTDSTSREKTRKDERFQLNPILRDRLSIEEEERKVIEQRVNERVDKVIKQAESDAIAKGYQAGLEKGRAESFVKFQEEAAQMLQGFESMVAELEGAKQEIFRQNERFLVELVFRIGRMMCLKELQQDKEYVLRLSRQLIERMGVRENIRIRIHPDEAATIGALREGLEKSFTGLKNLTIETSNQVKGGGCVLETDWNAIDASIDTQVKGLFDSLIEPPQEQPADAEVSPGVEPIGDPDEEGPPDGSSSESGS